MLGVNWQKLAVAGVAVACLLVTVLGWRFSETTGNRLINLEFERGAREVERALSDRMRYLEGALRAAQGFAGASEETTAAEWTRFIDTLRLRPGRDGLVGIAFYERQETPGGGDRYVIRVAAPPERLKVLIGIEATAHPPVHEAIERAEVTGQPAMSSRFSGRLADLGAAGATDVVYVAPVAGPEADENPGAPLRGMISMGLNTDALFSGVFRALPQEVAAAVYDGAPSNADRLLYRTGEPGPEGLRRTASISVGGRVWTLVVQPAPTAATAWIGLQGMGVLAVGLVFTLLITTATWLLVTRRAAAEALAREMTEALKESEERYRSLFEGNQAVELLIEPADGRIIDANHAAVEFYGWSREDLLARRISEINTLSAAEVAEEMRRANRESRSHFLFRHRLADGRVRDVEVHSGPVVVQGRRMLYSIVHDITERREAERALRASETRFRSLFEQSSLAMVVLDPEGVVRRANKAWQTLCYGDAGAERIGSPVGCLFTADPRIAASGLGDLVEQAIAGESVVAPPLCLEPPAPAAAAGGDGGPGVRWLRAFLYPVRDGSDRVTEIIVMAEDVTDRRDSERRMAELLKDLERSNADLAQFAYVASHDLQEPLRMVTSYMTLLERRYGDRLDADGREFIAFAVDGARRMQDLINDLLQYSRVGTRGAPLLPVDAGAALDEALGNLRVAIEEAQADITVDPLPRVLADRGQLARLFQNVIGNALKYHRPDTPPRVHVSAEPEDGLWHLRMSDNGIGIPEADRDRVFMIFQRLHTRDEYSGTGIGLAICKKIAERHGGRMWVDENPEGGSTFHVTLRAAPPDAAETPHDEARRIPADAE